MNTDWMRERLECLLHECEQYERNYDGEWHEGTLRPIMDRVDDQVPTVRRIIEALDADLIPDDFGVNVYLGGLRSTSKSVRQALAVLRDQQELRLNLAPEAPALSADRFHPIVWFPAAPLWPTGEFKAATTNAAVALSSHIKQRTKSHLNERELVQQVFSTEPPKAGQVRLHLQGNPMDRNWKSAQEGLHLIAQGAFAGIRNAAVHGEKKWTEHVALEHLAVLSVVARWSEEADVVSAS